MDLRHYNITGRPIAIGVALALALPATWATAQGAKQQQIQSTKLENVAACNGEPRATFEAQIGGCTVLIEGGLENPQTLVIAYLNRGDALVGQGKYDLAIKDFEESIKLNPNYFKTYNNCLLYTSDAADEEDSVDLGGRRIIK